VFLAVFAKERGVGKSQVVRYFLHRHIREAQTILDSLHGIELYIGAWPAVHHFLDNG
jgi:hypothetical protein